MKKILIALLSMFSTGQFLTGQAISKAGEPIVEIFTDFHAAINDTSGTTGFSLNRAYLGYRFLPDNNFSATIILNAGTPDDLPPESEPRRYAFFREASICWSADRLKVSFGITGTHLFDFQQRFWGKRYIASTYQSLNEYGYVADLGIAADYVLNDVVKADVTVMNGEGYSNLQLDNSIKTSLAFTITPGSHLAMRVYTDLLRVDGLWQSMFLGFIGYKSEKVTIGGEASYKSNLEPVKGHHGWGFSGTGSIGIAKNTEVFARYDYSASKVPAGETKPWNYLNDGSFIVAGFQFVPADYVKLALDYQGTCPYSGERHPYNAIYMNAQFKF